jgi:hypothetical protein
MDTLRLRKIHKDLDSENREHNIDSYRNATNHTSRKKKEGRGILSPPIY